MLGMVHNLESLRQFLFSRSIYYMKEFKIKCTVEQLGAKLHSNNCI